MDSYRPEPDRDEFDKKSLRSACGKAHLVFDLSIMNRSGNLA